MHVLGVLTLVFICYFLVLGTRHVNGRTFSETDAMKAGYESVLKIINQKTDYSEEDFNVDLQELKDRTYNDGAQAVGDRMIPKFAEFLKEKVDKKRFNSKDNRTKSVIDMIAFTIILFNPEVATQGKELSAAERIKQEPNFETMVLDQVFVKGPVFGMGTSFFSIDDTDYYLMTFSRGNKILDKFMDILAEGQILVSAVATNRAIKYRAQRMKRIRLEDDDLRPYSYYTIIKTPCDQEENAESALLAAVPNLQPNSCKNFYEVFMNKSSLIHDNNAAMEIFQYTEIVSYGFSSWYMDGDAYLGIFYKTMPIKYDAFPVPRTTCEDKISFIPRVNYSDACVPDIQNKPTPTESPKALGNSDSTTVESPTPWTPITPNSTIRNPQRMEPTKTSRQFTPLNSLDTASENKTGTTKERQMGAIDTSGNSEKDTHEKTKNLQPSSPVNNSLRTTDNAENEHAEGERERETNETLAKRCKQDINNVITKFRNSSPCQPQNSSSWKPKYFAEKKKINDTLITEHEARNLLSENFEKALEPFKEFADLKSVAFLFDEKDEPGSPQILVFSFSKEDAENSENFTKFITDILERKPYCLKATGDKKIPIAVESEARFEVCRCDLVSFAADFNIKNDKRFGGLVLVPKEKSKIMGRIKSFPLFRMLRRKH